MARPRLWISYGVKYEPDWLVRDMRANLSWADGFAEVNHRHRTGELWVNEAAYRRMQRQALIDAGVRYWDWVLVTSPDERWEDNARDVMRGLIAAPRKVIYSFPLREMFTPTAYRTDGFWGRKTRPRLYPFLPGQRFTDRRIQSAPTPVTSDYKRLLDPRVNLYHLKNIEPENRNARAEVYDALDPDRKIGKRDSARWVRLDPEGKFRRMGYRYLADLDGMELEEIPTSRGFSPPYRRRYVFSVPPHLLAAERAKHAARTAATTGTSGGSHAAH